MMHNFFVLVWTVVILIAQGCSQVGTLNQSQQTREPSQNGESSGSSDKIEIELESEETEAIQPPENITGSYLACETVSSDTDEQTDFGCQLRDSEGQIDLTRAASARWDVISDNSDVPIRGDLNLSNDLYHYGFSIQATGQALEDALPKLTITARYLKNIEAEELEYTAKLPDALAIPLQPMPNQVCFYEHEDFLGQEVCHRMAFETTEITSESPLFNDMTSLSIQGEFLVTLNNGVNFGGTQRLVINNDVPSLLELGFDDQTVSYRIEVQTP